MTTTTQPSILIIGTDTTSQSGFAHNIRSLIAVLKDRDAKVDVYDTYNGLIDGNPATGRETSAVLIDWNLQNATELITKIREQDADISIFLITEPGQLAKIPPDVFSLVNEYIWILGDTPEFIAGRILAAARRYHLSLLPPMFKALVNFSDDFEDSWHTPGHTAGTAFLKSPSGREFYNFFGEQMFRSDLSISVGELGSLLDHSGPIGDAEKYAAKVFGADMTFFVTNGTSTSNRVVQGALAGDGDIVLIDRNCHKSLEQSLTLDHARPAYLIPSRNRYGILGSIPPYEMTPDKVMAKTGNKRPSVSVVTNSTYDGICYNAEEAEKLLEKTTDAIHFDEAWYGYAKFHPIYRKRFGMYKTENTDVSERPTIITTQSTHKLLAALSQASMIHIRNGRHHITPSLFNESFMMHASTSPFYPLIASLDVSSKMMDMGGEELIQESIDEAIRFRQTLKRSKIDWFTTWQPDYVRLKDGKEVPFEDAEPSYLASEPSCWTLKPNDSWHGFGNIPEGWAMLDPVKVTVLTPGMGTDGNQTEFGIPASIVVSFLDTKGIINEKTGDYNILFLFSMGVTKGKWGTLLSELFAFKKLYEQNTPLEDVLPSLTANYPEVYQGMTLPELCSSMHAFMRENRQTQTANEACAVLPEMVYTPAEAYRKLVLGKVESVRLDDIDNRIVATGVVPYPPGIPILMPGERTGRKTEPVLSYLKILQEFDRRFPGFSHDIHGVEAVNGDYHVHCITEE